MIARHYAKQDEFGAFVPGPPVTETGAATGPLRGRSFVAKDLFDIAGLVTGCGNPDWALTHPPARQHASAVARLLDAGATLVGRTITDEISLGLLGCNQFQGTPINPRAPERLPGGSSSGSAAAVAGGLADFALGSDSGGSVRVPASFTGLFGLRPTHGAISADGLMTQSPSFDTVGFFARTAQDMVALGSVLLDGRISRTPEELIVASDSLEVCDPLIGVAVERVVKSLRSLLPRERDMVLAEEGLGIWSTHQRRLQQAEYYRTFCDWIDRCNPRFSFEVSRSLAKGSELAEEDLSADQSFRLEVRRRLESLLEDRKVLCLPTTPILPPLRTAPLSAMTEASQRIVTLTCVAGLTGLPQLSLPLAEVGGVPVGVSLIGWRGGDHELLKLGCAVSAGST